MFKKDVDRKIYDIISATEGFENMERLLHWKISISIENVKILFLYDSLIILLHNEIYFYKYV